MLVTDNEDIYTFDVDKTLVSERRSDPIDGDVCVFNPYTGRLVYVRPHRGHIDLLKEMRGRGRHIIVWSAAGVKWAESVVMTLGLQDCVHEVKTKPLGYVDDEPVEKWLRNHIYLGAGDRT